MEMNKVKIKNIRTRLLLVLLPLIFIILALLSGISYYFSKQALNQSVNETAMALGTDYSVRVKNDIELRLIQLDGLANTPIFRAGTDKTQIVNDMVETKKRLGTFDTITFALPDGSGITDAGKKSFYGDREYFKKAISTQKAVVSEPLVAKTTGKLAVILAVPITNNGQLSGLLLGTYSMERLSNMIGNMKFLDSGYGQLVDDSGLIIADPKNQDLVGKLNLTQKNVNSELNLSQNTLDDQLINLFQKTVQSGRQTEGFYSFVDSVKQFAVFTPVDLPGDQHWILTVSAPEKEGTKAVDHLSWMMLILSIVCMAVAIISIIFIAKQFTKPISVLRDECLLLTQGDLRDREEKISSEDEIGQLAKGFRDMRANLHELVGNVHLQAEQLSASSEELTANSEQSAQAANHVAETINNISAGSENQVKVVDKTTNIVEQLSAGIQDVAANASNVAATAQQTSNAAQEGGKAVQQVTSQMLQIEKTVDDSAQLVTKLGERSKKIGAIIDTISGIAGQTTLLALNAAIEAARAGEQGRGFAVVANEVNSLAEQSQEAAKQIAEMINEIQNDTDKAVNAMNEGTHEVKTGTAVVNSTGQKFEEIVNLIGRVSDQVNDISAAIEQMAASSQNIVDSVKVIDKISKDASAYTQTVSAATEEQLASMEEIASASQALAKLAQDLQTSVTKFKI